MPGIIIDMECSWWLAFGEFHTLRSGNATSETRERFVPSFRGMSYALMIIKESIHMPAGDPSTISGPLSS